MSFGVFILKWIIGPIAVAAVAIGIGYMASWIGGYQF